MTNTTLEIDVEVSEGEEIGRIDGIEVVSRMIRMGMRDAPTKCRRRTIRYMHTVR